MIGSRPILRALTLGLAPILSVAPQAARADVISPPPDGCDQSSEIGEIDVEMEFVPPSGDTCFENLSRPLKVTATVASWAPREIPLFVAVKRDRTGYRVFLMSMISDRRNRNTCWSEAAIGRSEAQSPSTLWREVARAFDRWAARCPAIQTIGTGVARASFLARQSDFRRGFARLAAIRPSRFGPPEDGIGVGSFLPTHVSQQLLDAIADACEAPRQRLRLQADGRIAFDYDPHLPYGADGSRPVDSCVQEQIRYLPGSWTD